MLKCLCERLKHHRHHHHHPSIVLLSQPFYHPTDAHTAVCIAFSDNGCTSLDAISLLVFLFVKFMYLLLFNVMRLSIESTKQRSSAVLGMDREMRS